MSLINIAQNCIINLGSGSFEQYIPTYYLGNFLFLTVSGILSYYFGI